MVEAAGIEPASVGGRCCLASCISRPRYAIGGIEGGGFEPACPRLPRCRLREVTEVAEAKELSASWLRAHNPKVVGSNPTPATI